MCPLRKWHGLRPLCVLCCPSPYISQTSTYVYNGEFSGKGEPSPSATAARAVGAGRDFVSAISIFVAISESGSLPPFTESGILSYGAPFYDQQLPSVRTTDADADDGLARSLALPGDRHRRHTHGHEPTREWGRDGFIKSPDVERGIKKRKQKMRRRISKWPSDSDGKIARSVFGQCVCVSIHLTSTLR